MEDTDIHEFKRFSEKIFIRLDEDKDGLITVEEAVKFFEEVNEDISNSSIKSFFSSVDEDYDDLISFEELFTYFTSKTLEDDSYVQSLKRRILKFQDEEDSKPETSQENVEDQLNQYLFNVIVGDPFEPKTTAVVRVSLGEEAEGEFQEVSKGLSLKENCGIVICLRAKDPSRAADTLRPFIRVLLEFINSLISPNNRIDLKKVKDETIVYENTVKIGLQPEACELSNMVEQLTKVKSLLIPDRLIAEGSFELNLQRDLFDILEEEADILSQNGKKKSLIHYLFEGASIALTAKLSNIAFGKLRNRYFESRAFKKLPNSVKNLAFLLLWKSMKAELVFKKFRGSVLEEIFPKIITDLSVEKTLEYTKGMIDPLRKKFFVLKTLLSIANRELIADCTCTIKAPKFLMSLGIKTRGIREVYDRISQ